MTGQRRHGRSLARTIGTLAAATIVVTLAAGTLFMTGVALEGLVANGGPPTTPTTPTAVALAEPSGSPASSPSIPAASPSPSAAPPASATPKPKPFSMDLYRARDFVGEKTVIWCLAAAVQTSINIMSPGADVSRATQQRLFNLARSLAPAPDGAAEPEGWAKALTKLGFGGYTVSVHPTIRSAITAAAKAIRATGRPAGLLVWRGAHSWVMSGFAATADPALTDQFTVTAVRIEDVWYPRYSKLWGYSRPPDALVPVGKLPEDFRPWKRPQARYPAKDGKFVIVIPTR
jgi:hypothetical protein